MYFIVIRAAGPNWDHTLPMRDQRGWDEHAEFIELLAEEGFVILVGPLDAGSDFHRAMLLVDAENEEAVHTRLAPDPWTSMEMLTTTAVERWEILIGNLRS
jgi:uncharacterized protein YciI